MFNTFLDTLHNVFNIFFCCTVLYLSSSIILDYSANSTNLTNSTNSTDLTNSNNIELIIKQYDSIYFYSTIFFLISGIINILDKSYLFIVHHIISWISIYYGYFYKNPDYIVWICKNLLAELSSIFLSIDIILKNTNNKDYNNMLVKILFFISYTLVRIVYLVPININYLLTNSFEDNYKYLLPIAFYFMQGLNIYWYILIVKKFIKYFLIYADSRKIY